MDTIDAFKPCVVIALKSLEHRIRLGQITGNLAKVAAYLDPKHRFSIHTNRVFCFFPRLEGDTNVAKEFLINRGVEVLMYKRFGDTKDWEEERVRIFTTPPFALFFSQTKGLASRS